ncbi:MAG: AMP-binding protein [Chloroflexi bacterium]|nr:AMP-binding protein [Chloroflexota bacterium]
MDAAGVSPEPLRRSPRPLPQALARSLLRRAFRTLAVDDWRSWRGLHLYLGASALAREIRRQSTCERVGVMLPTSGLFPVAMLATWLLGRSVVPVNYLLKREERDYVLRDAGVDLVVTVAPMLERFGELPTGVRPLLFDRVAVPRMPRPLRAARIDPQATAVLIYTSGTSGKPKGVELTFANLAVNVEQCRQFGDVTSKDIFLGVLPQFHSFGLTVLTLLPLMTGAKVVYTAQFNAGRLFELMRTHRPTGFVGIPAMFAAMLRDHRAGPPDLVSIRLLISGAEPLPASTREDFEQRFGKTIYEGYGLTECGPVLNWSRPGEGVAGSVGRALPGVEEKVVDVTGQRVPTGAEGEVCVRGPNIMKGYYLRPETTAGVFDRDGYFHTGDLGRLDEEGRLWITGRKSDLIIVGGENVHPREIEEILNRHASVVESAVIGVPDRIRGEVPVAFVKLVAGAPLDEAQLRAYCGEQLPRYKVPRRVVLVDDFPRGATGKILKRLIPRDGLCVETPAL